MDREPLKRCSRCGEQLLSSMFHLRTAAPDGRQPVCKACRAAMDRERYARQGRRPHTSRGVDPRRRRAMNALLDYLEDKQCADCGETDPLVLEFDHLRDKEANVSALVAMGSPWRVIAAEIAKCDVVCGNCHRRRTVARLGGLRSLWTG